MKYDDEELALAAVLLAHEPGDAPMPEALERTILAQGRSFAADVRFSTTKAAAVAMTPPAAVAKPRSFAREWGAWVAAAACFAFGVYEWRVSVLSHEAAERAVASARAALSSTVLGQDPSGATRFSLRWSDETRSGEVRVMGLPDSAPGERYALWLSSGEAADAVPVGSFTCRGDCAERPFEVRASGELGPLRHAWLTIGTTGEPATTIEHERIVAEGRDGRR